MAEIKKISTELQLLDKFLDTSGDAGTSGQVLTSTGTGINWVSGGSLPGGPYLPLLAGSSYPLTDTLYLPNTHGIQWTSGGSSSIKSTSDIINIRSYSGIELYSAVSTADIVFNNNQSGELMRVKGTGNVGIGTTLPVEKLDTPNIAIGGSTITGYTANKLRIDNNGGTSRFYSTGANTTTNGQYVFHVTSSDGSLNPEIMRITSTGRIGIGTTSPATKFVIAEANATGLEITPVNSSNLVSIIAYDRSNSAYREINLDGSNYNFEISNSTKMVIDTSGNVGIGTTLPAGRLDVDGDNYNTATDTKMFITDHGNNYNNGDLAATLTFRSRYWSGDDNTGATVSNIKHYKGAANGTGGSDLAFETATTAGAQTEKLRISAAGAIKFNAYDSTNQTGTPTYLLGTDASGNVVKTNTVPGSGAGPYLPLSAGSSYPLTGNLWGTSSIFSSTVKAALFTIKNSSPYIQWENLSATRLAYIQHSTNLVINTDSGEIRLQTPASTNILLNPGTGGNVGIGTTSPNSALEIYQGGSGKVTMLQLARPDTPGLQSNIQFTVGSDIMVGQIQHEYEAANLNHMSFTLRAVSGVDIIPLWLENSGNVGIGTTSPGAKLDVNGDVFINSNYTGSNAAANDLTIGKTTTGNHGITIATGPTYTGSIYFGDSGNNDAGIIGYQHSDNSMQFVTNRSEAMRIDSAGNVGIQNTSPSSFDTWQRQLVVGSGSADAGITIYHGSGSGNQGAISFADGNTGSDRYRGSISYNGADEMKFYTSTTERMRITSAGELQVTGNGVIRNEHSSANFSFWQQTSTDARFFTQYAQPLYFGTNASTRMTILSGGNVGIGTTGPQGKLEVNNRNTATGAALFIKGGEDDLSPIAGQYTGLAFGYGGGTIYNNAAILWEFTNTAANGKLHFAVNPTAGDGTADLSDSKMTIQDNGNVGIGTTSPGSPLHIAGTEPSNGVSLAITTGTDDIGLRASSTRLDIVSSTASVWRQLQAGSFVGNVNEISSFAGNVGIGTTSPNSALEIYQGGSGKVTMLQLARPDTPGLQSNIQFTVGSDIMVGQIQHEYEAANLNHMSFTLRAVSGVDIIPLWLENSGNVGIGTTSPGSKLQVDGGIRVADGTKAAPSYSFTSDTNTGMYSDAADTIKLAVGGNDTLIINSSSNVGIGTSAPDVKFHVTTSEDGSGIDKGTAKFINTNTGQGATTMHIVQTSSSSFANAVKFWQGSTPTPVGFIRLTTSATQFITSASDLNLKKNITNWNDDTLSKFKALEPKKFRFKTQDVSEDKTLGFIAQNEVGNFPEAYPQFLGEDEQPYYGFNPSGMVPHLMKAIKDLVNKVETLENRITQLEN
mgnify:CR=1 FL=1